MLKEKEIEENVGRKREETPRIKMYRKDRGKKDEKEECKNKITFSPGHNSLSIV